MAHQCVKCGEFYPDGSKELLEGCKCGGRFFFYVKKQDINKAKELTQELTKDDKKQIEKDVKEIIGTNLDDEKPVVLELENIRVLEPGKYELDLVDLFKGKPLVYKLEDGKYVIDIMSLFNPDQKNEKD